MRALEEEKNAVRLAFFLGCNTIFSEHASAFYFLLLLRTFLFFFCFFLFLGWLRFAIFDRCILLHYVWEDGGAEHQAGQREPWALAYSLLDIINVERFVD